jgi:hypothetical protein
MHRHKNSIDELSMHHADLCVQIEYRQGETIDHDLEKPNHDLYMTPSWMFGTTNRCFEVEGAVHSLNRLQSKYGRGGDLIKSNNKGIDKLNCFLIAMVQFSITNDVSHVLHEGNWVFEPFRNAIAQKLIPIVRYNLHEASSFCNSSLSDKAKADMHKHKKRFGTSTFQKPDDTDISTIRENVYIQPDDDEGELCQESMKEQAKLFFMQSKFVGVDSTYEYIVEVMMKLTMVKNIHHTYTDLDHYVRETYDEILKEMSLWCDDEKMAVTLKNGNIPALPSYERHQDCSEDLIVSVRDWFRGFVLVRCFGRRIAIEHHKVTTFPNIKQCELQWLNNSISSSQLDALKFVDECYKSLAAFDITPTPTFSLNYHHENKIHDNMKNYNDLVVDNPLNRIMLRSFVPLLQYLYGYFRHIFQFQSRHQTNRFTSKSSLSPSLYMKSPDFNEFDKITRSKLSLHLLHKAETGNPKSDNTGVRSENVRHPKSPGNKHIHGTERSYHTIVDSSVAEFITHWFGDQNGKNGQLVKIQRLFNHRNRNMKKTMKSDQDTQRENRLSACIKKYIDVNIQSTVSSLQPRVYIILKSLLDQNNFKTALYQTINVICSDYAALTVAGARFATPEINQGTEEPLQYWDNPHTFKFFIFTLIASLHSCTYNRSERLTVSTKWLLSKQKVESQIQDRYSREVNLTVMKQMSRDLVRKHFSLPHCLKHFCELFPCVKATDMCESEVYSYFDIISCLLECSTNGLKKQQFKTFKWQFINDGRYNNKNIMEHTICVILILLSVDVVHSDIEYNAVVPPPFIDEKFRTSESRSKSHGDAEKNSGDEQTSEYFSGSESDIVAGSIACLSEGDDDADVSSGDDSYDIFGSDADVSSD